MSRQTILNFLDELKDNNNREWMEAHKNTYQQAKRDFETLVTEVIARLREFDEGVEGLEAKKCIFRLNRDIRFSKDKSPYKLNFGAAMQKGGRKSPFGGYYLHIQPNQESFAGGGIYMPEAANLAKIRQEIDYNANQLKEIIYADEFKKKFGDLWGEKVKTSPKGYSKDHPEIELLKFKSFVVFEKITDEDVLKGNYIDKCIASFKMIKPLNDYLNEAIAE